MYTNEKTVKLMQIDRLLFASKTSPTGTRSNNSGMYIQGILPNRYTQREFKLEFSAILIADDIKYTENSKN